MHPTNLSIDLYLLRTKRKKNLHIFTSTTETCVYLSKLFQAFPMFYKYTVFSEHSEKVLSGIICNTS